MREKRGQGWGRGVVQRRNGALFVMCDAKPTSRAWGGGSYVLWMRKSS
jgi:hypothetical protein